MRTDNGSPSAMARAVSFTASRQVKRPATSAPLGKAASRRKVQFGNRKVAVGSLQRLADSTPLFRAGDWAALRARLHADGVLLVRGVVDRAVAVDARRLLLKTVEQKGALAPGSNYQDGIIGTGKDGKLVPGYTVDALSGGLTDERDDDQDGWLAVGTSTTMSSVFDGGYLRGFLAGLFGGPDNIETLPENTWLRLKGRGDVTIEHADYFYFKRSTDMFERYATDDEKVAHDGSCGACGRTTGSMVHCGLCTRGWHTSCMDASARPSGASSSVSTWHCSSCADGPLSVFTCWCALGDIDLQDSTLAFVPGTHTLTGYDRARAGEQVPSSFKGGSARWHVADGTLRPGDIFIFNVKTIHCASKNGTTRFRASLDTRVELTRPGRRAWPRLVAQAAPQLK